MIPAPGSAVRVAASDFSLNLSGYEGCGESSDRDADRDQGGHETQVRGESRDRTGDDAMRGRCRDDRHGADQIGRQESRDGGDQSADCGSFARGAAKNARIGDLRGPEGTAGPMGRSREAFGRPNVDTVRSASADSARATMGGHDDQPLAPRSIR